MRIILGIYKLFLLALGLLLLAGGILSLPHPSEQKLAVLRLPIALLLLHKGLEIRCTPKAVANEPKN
jgi:hypothetical protein